MQSLESSNSRVLNVCSKEKLRIAGVTGMAYYRPVEGAREIPVNPAETALLFIDVQNFNCNIKGALMASMSPEKLQVTLCVGCNLPFHFQEDQ